MSDFSKNLYNLRTENGYTLDGLAKAINQASGTNFTKSTFSKWERGATEPAFQSIVPIADFFHVTVDYLIGVNTIRVDDNSDKFSIENARLVGKIRNDKELTDALKVYFSLPEDKKKYAVNLIRMLGD